MRSYRAAVGVLGLVGSLAAGSIAATPHAVQAQSAIPDRLADSTFWRLITTFSEPSGFFASDNYVSNENEWQYVIPAGLQRANHDGAYLGVGPEQNFTYIAALKPRIAFICDIRRQNMMQHLMYKALIEMSADRADLLSMLFARTRPVGVDTAASGAQLVAAYSVVAPDRTLYEMTLVALFEQLTKAHGFRIAPEDSVTIRTIYTVFVESGLDVNYASGGDRSSLGVIRSDTGTIMRRPLHPGYSTFGSLMLEDDGTGANRGWLGTEAAFRTVKDYELRNLIVPVVGDFAGTKALRSVSAYLKETNTRVSTFYVSNVEQYLFEDASNWSKFYANVAAMPLDSSSFFIRSLSNRAQVQPRKPDSRLAQLTSSIQKVVTAFQSGALRTYFDLIELRDR